MFSFLVQLPKSSNINDATTLHNIHPIRVGQELKLVRHQNPGLLAKLLGEAFPEHLFSNVCIDCRQRVIKYVYVGVGVYGSSHRHTLLLASREIDPFLSNLGQISGRKRLQIIFEGSRIDRFGIRRVVVILPENDVASKGVVENPRRLSCICDRTSHVDASLKLRNFTKHRRDQRRFSAADRSDNCYELSRFRFEVDVFQFIYILALDFVYVVYSLYFLYFLYFL
mmetsp:Transcript_6929/g.10221  ORF Transcript_6929/g.10221 Transcript_6929/m.10221 type:complete len:225 (-) Transcript_6929:167-841(-)